jgi:hypothetical protein
MGTSTPSIAEQIEDFEKQLRPMRRALHGREQMAFDEMMVSLAKYRTAIASASSEEAEGTNKDGKVVVLDTLHPIDLMNASLHVEAFTRIALLEEKLAEQNGTGLMKAGR